MDTAYVIHPYLSGRKRIRSVPHNQNTSLEPDDPLGGRGFVLRSPDAALEEAIGLAAAIDLRVLGSECVALSGQRPSTLLGSGKIEALKAQFAEQDIKPTILIMDTALTPVQHRNLEKALDMKVLDRTALILEIFGARAQTREGALQVELAHLTYQRSRLVRSWTHLERQRGGAGFLGGPGERQIESDRRVISDKIVRLKKKIEEVRRTRTLQRSKRKRAPHPVVALVGYTNAGKSTLFNAVTQAEVMAEDLLFATLDPTMRAVDLPSGLRIVMSDTVGFISQLPTQLVAAFRATLEEVLEADMIIHVRDVTHPDHEAQKADVLAILEELGIEDNDNGPTVIEVFNKTDLLSSAERHDLTQILKVKSETAKGTLSEPFQLALSAIEASGLESLFARVDGELTRDRLELICTLPVSAGEARAFLYQHADVFEEEIKDRDMALSVRISEKTLGQFLTRFQASIQPFETDHPNLTGMRAS